MNMLYLFPDIKESQEKYPPKFKGVFSQPSQAKPPKNENSAAQFGYILLLNKNLRGLAGDTP